MTIASRNRIWNFGQLAEKTVLSPTIEVIIKKGSMYFGDFREGNSTKLGIFIKKENLLFRKHGKHCLNSQPL